MLGKQISETKGKRIVRRVLSTDPPTVEVTFEDSGEVYGIRTTGMGTYTAVIAPDQSILGSGQGIITTQDGEGVGWTGTGIGKIGQAEPSVIAACSSSRPPRKNWPSSTMPAEPSNTKLTPAAPLSPKSRNGGSPPPHSAPRLPLLTLARWRSAPINCLAAQLLPCTACS
jgi:hypothetical protein